MLRNFTEWVEERQANESFTSAHQSPGDMVFFGAHDILAMPDDQPIDRSVMGPKLSVIKAVGPKGIALDAPERHNFRAKSVKKFMSKGGGFTIPPDHLQEISPKLITGGLGNNQETGQPQKLFIFTPNAYTKQMLIRKNQRMSQAAPTPGANPALAVAPEIAPQPSAQPQPQLPAPQPTGLMSSYENFQYGEGRSYRYY